MDTTARARPGSLSRYVFAALDLRQLGARKRGEAAFNVSRVIGHARSTIVDTIYAHTVDSALAGVSQSVAASLMVDDALRETISGTLDEQ